MAAKIKGPQPIVVPDGNTGKPFPDVNSEWEDYTNQPIDDAIMRPINTANPNPINNTAPSGKTDFQDLNIPQPIGAGSAYPAGSRGAAMVQNQRNPFALQSTAADRPYNYPSPAEQKGQGYAASALAGLGAGGTVQPTTNSTDAALQVGGSALTGAATGALYGSMAGGPGAVVGGVVGGVVGLVSGGLNAYVGTKAAREARRQQEKINAQILARQEARYQQERADQEKYFNINRADELEQVRYNRKKDAQASMWKAQESARLALNDAINQDQNLKQILRQQVH